MRMIDAEKMAVEESEAYIFAQSQIKDELTRSVNAVVHTKIQRLIADTPTVDAAEVMRDQWISVKDRLPETEDEVLVLTMSKNGNINVDKGYFANGRFVHRGRAEVTHWMPLPEPPEEVMR
ncbi:MAG: DUF551 domain-containing protein [Firmicutes bacterium]|nr:DUF551 domain-containing protein [Bacillota bacterium]